MTDHWERVTWNRGKLDDIAARQKNTSQVKHQWLLQWLLDGQVGRIVYTNEQGLRSEEEQDEVALFLTPMHGGIWTLCVSLTGKLAVHALGSRCSDVKISLVIREAWQCLNEDRITTRLRAGRSGL
jgi:hypothetical protein